MKILVTLSYLLIAGISSFTTVSQGLFSGGPSHLAILGFLNTTIEDIEKFDRALCATNGGPTAYDDQKKSQERYAQCDYSVEQEVSHVVMMARANSPLQNPNMIYLQEYCRRISSFGNCFRYLTDSMKICLDVKKHESADIMYNIYSSVMGSIFEDCSETGIENVGSVSECVEFQHSALAKCVNQTFSKYVQATVSNGSVIGGVGFFHLLIPDLNKCTVLDTFQHCAVGVLRNCTPSISMDLPNAIFKRVKEATTCDYLLKSQASPAPRVVDIALITGLTAISLRFLHT